MTGTIWRELVVAYIRDEALPELRRAVEDLPGRLRLNSSQKLAVPRVALPGSLVAGLEDEAGELLF